MQKKEIYTCDIDFTGRLRWARCVLGSEELSGSFFDNFNCSKQFIFGQLLQIFLGL